MVTFTREDRRGRVLEHHSQGMGTREISKLLHMSFTDIGKILKDSDKEKESEQQRTRQEFLSSQAYTLFQLKKFSDDIETIRRLIHYFKLKINLIIDDIDAEGVVKQ